MCQKDATCENTERAQGTEKLTINANDEKHKRKSLKSQKGGNEHKKSKNFECNAESKAIEQLKPTTETAEQEQRRVKEGRSRQQKRYAVVSVQNFSSRTERSGNENGLFSIRPSLQCLFLHITFLRRPLFDTRWLLGQTN
jgi:hypothetical protein